MSAYGTKQTSRDELCAFYPLSAVPYREAHYIDRKFHNHLSEMRASATERMPTHACQFFYDCKGCGQRLRRKSGDFCVFYSYGSALCPPVQAGSYYKSE
jgi:hypothetical protein